MTTTIARKRAPHAVPPAVRADRSVVSELISKARLAAADGHPMAMLMRLRDEAADEIDRLLAFLDATEGDIDLEDGADDEPGHDIEQTDGAPVTITACGRVVRL